MCVNKILFCVPSANSVGGMQTWLERICRGLDPECWRPIVGLVRGAKANCPDAFIEAHRELETVIIDGAGMGTKDRIMAVSRTIKRIKPSIFIPINVLDANEAICRMKLRGQGTKYLMTVIGNIPDQIADAQRYRNFVDLAVCPGSLTCRLLEWIGVPDERIRHIPNGAGKPLLKRSKRNNGDPIRLAYVGRLSNLDKRILDIIPFCKNLIKQQIHFTLDIVGDGPEKERLEQKLNSLEYKNFIRFHGQKSIDEIYQYVYPNIDCLLLFSESEAFGISIVEAMMHEVVPVTSKFVGHSSEGFLIDGVSGMLFNIGDTEGAALCVQKLAEDYELYEKIAKETKRKVHEKYTWDACIKGWSNAFIEILDLKARIGSDLPDSLFRQQGRLEEIGIPEDLTYLIRRLRNRFLGVPQKMIGGEEWPWISKSHDKTLIEEIEALAIKLDNIA